MATPHIRAKEGEVAKCILLPGDPRRAKFIAENFLEDPVLFNDVRGILGYTGTYKGRKISVMGTGMGMPSIHIYTSELMSQYGVKVAMRIGTCGSQNPDAQLGDVVMAQGCCTTSNMNHRMFNGYYAPVADFDLLRTAYLKAKERGLGVAVGNMLSSDSFYPLAPDPRFQNWFDFGVIGIEMEGAALYTVARKYDAKALMLCTVSDSVADPKGMTPEQRETSLTNMITLALDTIWEFAE